MIPYKYIVKYTKEPNIHDVPVNVLLDLHEMGYVYTSRTMVYERCNNKFICRTSNELDFLYTIIGSFNCINYGMSFDVYRSDRQIINTVSDIKYIEGMLKVNHHGQSKYLQDLVGILDLYEVYKYYNVSGIMSDYINRGKIRLVCDNVSLCSEVIYNNHTYNMFDFIHTIKLIQCNGGVNLGQSFKV